MSLFPTGTEDVELKGMPTGSEPLWTCELKGHLPEKWLVLFAWMIPPGTYCTNTHRGALSVFSFPRFIKTFILFWPLFEVMEDSSPSFLLICVYFMLLRKKQVVLFKIYLKVFRKSQDFPQGGTLQKGFGLLTWL